MMKMQFLMDKDEWKGVTAEKLATEREKAEKAQKERPRELDQRANRDIINRFREIGIMLLEEDLKYIIHSKDSIESFAKMADRYSFNFISRGENWAVYGIGTTPQIVIIDLGDSRVCARFYDVEASEETERLRNEIYLSDDEIVKRFQEHGVEISHIDELVFTDDDLFETDPEDNSGALELEIKEREVLAYKLREGNGRIDFCSIDFGPVRAYYESDQFLNYFEDGVEDEGKLDFSPNERDKETERQGREERADQAAQRGRLEREVDQAREIEQQRREKRADQAAQRERLEREADRAREIEQQRREKRAEQAAQRERLEREADRAREIEQQRLEKARPGQGLSGNSRPRDKSRRRRRQVDRSRSGGGLEF